jgi:16S rRNA (guanine527-N7)-methyltransferase
VKSAVAATTPGEVLRNGLVELGLAFSDQQFDKLIAYVSLIQKWNRVYNLTAISEVHKIISHHLLDSLAIVPHLSGAQLLDVGSGAGFPGIPVAIARPDLGVTLLDSNSKKTAFLQQAALELELKNVQVVSARVEQPLLRKFDAIVSRAFAEIQDFVSASRHHLAPGGVFLAMKGVDPVEEIGRLSPDYRARAPIRLQVPRLDAERHLIIIEAA